jgi:hypothetical protein
MYVLLKIIYFVFVCLFVYYLLHSGSIQEELHCSGDVKSTSLVSGKSWLWSSDWVTVFTECGVIYPPRMY